MAGRPTDYDSAKCESVLEYGRQGKSITWMAAEIGVAKSTLYLWADVYPEFSDALKRARDLAQQWWEDAGQNNLLTPGFNASVYGKSMAARFPEDWRDNSKHEIVGKDGGPVEHSLTVTFTDDHD